MLSQQTCEPVHHTWQIYRGIADHNYVGHPRANFKRARRRDTEQRFQVSHPCVLWLCPETRPRMDKGNVLLLFSTTLLRQTIAADTMPSCVPLIVALQGNVLWENQLHDFQKNPALVCPRAF